MEINDSDKTKKTSTNTEKLFFGVDSKVKANTLLQNNLTVFQWVVRNKLYPAFWGRNIVGENALDKEEVDFLRAKGCQIALTYYPPSDELSEEQGKTEAKKAIELAETFGIPDETAIFLEVIDNNSISRDFLRGYAKTLLDRGYTPGFKANTDANYGFDRQFSRGMQSDKDIFEKCLIWAVSPTLAEYEKITDSHFIHPGNWKPFTPSGITRKDIAIWQYGKNCHPIEDDNENETVFNVNLMKNVNILLEKFY